MHRTSEPETIERECRCRGTGIVDGDGGSSVGGLLLRAGEDIDGCRVGLDTAGDESGGAAEGKGGVEEAFVDADAGGAFEGRRGEIVELGILGLEKGEHDGDE